MADGVLKPLLRTGLARDTLPRPGECPAQNLCASQAPDRLRRCARPVPVPPGLGDAKNCVSCPGTREMDKVCSPNASIWPHSPPTPAMCRRQVKRGNEVGLGGVEGGK